jgi:hypothetical protein
MGYEVAMQSTILALLRLFRERVHDPETSAWVSALVSDRDQWPRAHDLFDLIRERLIAATQDGGRPRIPWDSVDKALACQYSFEELCLKAVFNETDTRCPFDSCSPFWVAGTAIQLARELDMSVENVIAIIAPETKSSDAADGDRI